MKLSAGQTNWMEIYFIRVLRKDLSEGKKSFSSWEQETELMVLDLVEEQKLVPVDNPNCESMKLLMEISNHFNALLLMKK